MASKKIIVLNQGIRASRSNAPNFSYMVHVRGFVAQKVSYSEYRDLILTLHLFGALSPEHQIWYKRELEFPKIHASVQYKLNRQLR